MVETPVRTSTFAPLHDRHVAYNVETALGGVPHEVNVDPLFSDLQANPDLNVLGRLGSGRAGLYLGKYLKGVGRTRLAANWANPADLFHHSGHQAPSGAVREYLVSVFMKAKGCEALINPCEGVLLRPLHPELLGQLLPQIPKSPSGDVPPYFQSDLSLQAITVKREWLPRLSNLVWLSLHVDLTEPEPVTRLERVFAEVLGDSPSIASSMFANIERGLANLRRFWELGVLWGSLHNNFSVDGRYVDLEGPALVGRPLVGLVIGGATTKLTLPHSQMLSGLLEVYGYALYTQMLVWFFRTRFAALGRFPLLSKPERERAQAISEELQAEAREHVLFSRDELVARVLDWVHEAVPLTANESAALTATLRLIYDVHFSEDKGARGELDLRPLAPLEAGPFSVPATPHLFSLVRPRTSEGEMPEDVALVNRWINAIDREGDLERVFEKLEAAEEEIAESVRPVT